MKKKTYMKPLVSVCAIEALTILANSTDTPPTPKPVPSSGIYGGGDIKSGDDDDVWE